MTLPIWVGVLTGSPQHVAGVAAVEALPALLVGPLAGVLADRRDPRATMVACDLARAMLLVALLLAPRAALLPSLYVVGFLMACASMVFSPARNVALRLILARDEIPRGQALARATQSAALILGPLLGAGLLFRFGAGVGLLVDALSFGVGAFAFLLVRLPARPAAPPAPTSQAALRGLGRDLRHGVTITARDSNLVLLLLVTGVVHLVGNLWFAVDVFFVEQALGAPKEGVGLLWTASGAGGLVGSTLIAAWAGRIWQPQLLLAGLGLKGAALLWYAASTEYAWAVPATFLSGLGGAAIAVAAASLLLRWTPAAAVGRVTALFETANHLLTLAALAAVGLLAARLSPAQVLLLCGTAVCAAGIAVAGRLKALARDDEAAQD